MPSEYKRNCDICGEYYKGHSAHFCGRACKFSLKAAQNRLLKKVVYEENGCWTSLFGSISIKYDTKYHSIFKMAYSLKNEVDFNNVKTAYVHLCKNAKCVNPDHIVTTQEQNRNKYIFIPDEERFWGFVDKKSPNECWEWKGTLIKERKKGIGNYGKFSVRGKFVTASRYSYQLHYGEIPKSLYVCHTCDNPPCVNPDHLFLGTQLDNMRDMLSKGRDNYHRKYSKEFIDKLKKEVEESKTYKEVASKYDLTVSQVWSVLNNRKPRSDYENMGD